MSFANFHPLHFWRQELSFLAIAARFLSPPSKTWSLTGGRRCEGIAKSNSMNHRRRAHIPLARFCHGLAAAVAAYSRRGPPRSLLWRVSTSICPALRPEANSALPSSI
ncbi:hypothetical protein GQ53DRAFT_61700 [Thozetella sp. PMI_491]|nr:hypothetical protein GQ53DRAFT_61700 [Thozetella sp. PMI_491]